MSKKSDTHKNIYAALLAFQQEHGPVVAYDAQGYGYKYTSLPAIMKSIQPVLHKHGLVVLQTIEGADAVSVTTIIAHGDTDTTITSTFGPMAIPPMKGMSTWQSAGAGLSYLRRYAISSALGICTEEDKDAAAPQKSTEPYPQPKEPPKPVENEPHPSTPVTCPSCKEVTGMMKDTACWAKVGNDKKGTLRAMCGGCGHKFAVWA